MTAGALSAGFKAKQVDLAILGMAIANFYAVVLVALLSALTRESVLEGFPFPFWVIAAGITAIAPVLMVFHWPDLHAVAALLLTMATSVFVMDGSMSAPDAFRLASIALTFPVCAVMFIKSKNWGVLIGYTLLVALCSFGYYRSGDLRVVYDLVQIVYPVFGAATLLPYFLHCILRMRDDPDSKEKLRAEVSRIVNGKSWARLGKTLLIVFGLSFIPLIGAFLSLYGRLTFYLGWAGVVCGVACFLVSLAVLILWFILMIKHEADAGLHDSYQGIE